MNRIRNSILGAAALISLFIGFLVATPSPFFRFVILKSENQEILFAKKVEQGFKFATKIRHSVQLTPVWEFYTITAEGKIALVGTKLQDLGWGMPSTEEGTVRIAEGYMEFSRPPRVLQSLPFRICKINDPYLVLGNESYSISEHVEDGGLVIICVTKEPLWRTLFKGEANVFPKERKTRTGS